MFNEKMMYSRGFDQRGKLQSAVPWALGPDSPVWDDDSETTHALARQYVDLKIDQSRRMVESLEKLVETMNALPSTAATQRAPQVIGRLEQPDGSPAERVQVTLEVAGGSASDSRTATALTSSDGSFVIALPVGARATDVAVALVATSRDGVQRVADALRHLQPSGVLPPVRLPQPAPPLPPSLIAALRDLVDGIATTEDDEPGHRHGSTPAIAVGEDDCMVVFRKDSSSDRFPYGVLFRLTDPALSEPTLRFGLPSRFDKSRSSFTFYGPTSPETRLARKLSRMRFHLTERVPVDRPIDVEAFREGLAVDRPWGGVPVAGSLAIGYVVQMAQRWTPLGLALGDLVYSLPLAPGEQQRVAVMERSASSSVVESERLDSSEQMSFAERDESSATSTFASAFNEVASGGSHYDTEASSFSVAAAVGGGGVFPFGCVAGGVATSFGTSSSSGNTNTWMNGARNSTSQAAQNTHASVQRQAAARRSSSRTAMRLATAHETTEIVTKVITNHNKTRALTMQYWEVQRLFDVTTVAEGVNLVCLVPLEVIKFLPPGLPPRVTDAPDTRDEVLDRYGRMLTHADVLTRVVPRRHRRGLGLLTDFAANPTTAVADENAPSTEVLTIKAEGTFLTTDEVFVTVLGKRGMRIGPVRLDGSGPAYAPPTGTTALASEEALFGALRKARQSAAPVRWQARVSLPPSLPRQDVTGFEITRRTRRLDYTFAPPLVADLGTATGVLGPLGALGDAVLKAALDKPSVTRSYRSDRIETEVGGPRVSTFSAVLDSPGVAGGAGGGAPVAGAVELVAGGFGGGVELPSSTFPVAARGIPPVLSYASVLEIEKTFQWVVRNTMTCSLAVFASLTPEERAVMLERYEIELPPDENGNARPGVPLLSCITNNVLGWYGNSMVLPFIIPAAITEATGKWEVDAGGVRRLVEPGITTGDIQDALTRFHTDGFAPPRSTIALPTKGVLGEAVLGHCPSAEKIDLTRFWNWQDSPGDEATQISPVSMPGSSLLTGASAPSALTGLTPQIQNFSMAPPTVDTSLATALIAAAKDAKGFDIGALTNAGNLTTLGGKTIDTAEAARKDALASATKLAEKAMETSANIYTGKKAEAGKETPKPGGEPKPKPEPGPDPAEPDPKPKPTPPQTASVHFAHDEDDLTVAPAPADVTALDALVTTAKEAGATGAVVRGFASPEGTAAHNVDLAHRRADAVIAHLATLSLTATRAEGGVLAGAPGDFPKLRRADVAFTY